MVDDAGSPVAGFLGFMAGVAFPAMFFDDFVEVFSKPADGFAFCYGFFDDAVEVCEQIGFGGSGYDESFVVGFVENVVPFFGGDVEFLAEEVDLFREGLREFAVALGVEGDLGGAEF